MKNPVPKEELTLWLEHGLVESIRRRATELDLHVESLIEDALFEIFDSTGLTRIYGDKVPPTIKYRVKDDAENFKRIE